MFISLGSGQQFMMGSGVLEGTYLSRLGSEIWTMQKKLPGEKIVWRAFCWLEIIRRSPCPAVNAVWLLLMTSMMYQSRNFSFSVIPVVILCCMPDFLSPVQLFALHKLALLRFDRLHKVWTFSYIHDTFGSSNFLELNLKDVLNVSLTGKTLLKSCPMTSFSCGWTQVLAKIGYFYLSLAGNFISWNNHFPFSMFVIGVPFSSLLRTVLKGSII